MEQTEDQNTQEELLIPIDKYLDGFRGHLTVNNRVIFSAKFGDGKTYFLDQFKEKNKEEFLFLTIYPINYQVENNKDIFELIKRDILFQLFRENIVPDDIDLDVFTSSLFNKENIKEFIDFVGELASAFLPGTKLLAKAVKKGIDAKESYDEKKISAKKFLKKYQDMPGIYEFDVYTRFITEIIEQYKIKHTSKKVVLLIEDLDRIDPEHVFRILNIFSAHIDRKYMYNGENKVSSNKFSLDKVITVCDYQNLQSIYAHFYGVSTSFEGYINKFLERPPFQYSIKEAAIDYLYSYIETYCGLTRKFCEGISEDGYTNHSTPIYFFKDLVDSCSIREINNIVKDVDKQICFQNIKKEDIEISSCNSFTRFLVICKRLKCDWKKIQSNIKTNNGNKKVLLDCIGITLYKDLRVVYISDGGYYTFYKIRYLKEKIELEEDGRYTGADNNLILSNKMLFSNLTEFYQYVYD